MATPWFYVENGKRRGPVAEESLRGWLKAGTIPPESLVWTSGMAQWVQASTVPQLFQEPAAAPVAPIPFAPPQAPAQASPTSYDPQQTSDGGGVAALIPYRNVPALVGYYCGVFAIIPCFPIGIAGLVLGIIGLRKANRNPEIKGKVHAWIGIIFGGLFSLLWLVLTVVGIIAAIKDLPRH